MVINEEYLKELVKQAVREVLKEEAQKLDQDGKVKNLAAILSFRKVMEYLDCSRTHVYDLIDKGKLVPKYLSTKPYFEVKDILNELKPIDRFK